MSDMGKLNEEDIMGMLENSAPATKPKEDDTPVNANVHDSTADTRNLLVIGCGDGGCKIASEIGKRIEDDAYVIVYNTSSKIYDENNKKKVKADCFVSPANEDGSGKSRKYSKEVFKKGSFKYLLDQVKQITEKIEFDYIMICTTTDGGTGSGTSPMAAKLIADNVDIPVVVVGVYPSLKEDARAQKNTLGWQDEITRTGLPYMVFDNNMEITSLPLIHEKVNHYIADVMQIISGQSYSNEAETIIDNRDFYQLIQTLGRRLTFVTSTARPAVNQSLDQYVEKMIQEAHQPAPEGVRGVGLFVKAPQELIEKMNLSLSQIRAKYGDAELQYSHIEPADDIRISVLFAGSGEPEVRLYEIRSRYEDIMNNRAQAKSVASSILSDLDDDEDEFATKKKTTGSEPNLDALDF